MVNILDGITKMSDDALRMQIAFFRNITWKNVAKETGNRVLGGLAGLANAFTEVFQQKGPFDYQAEKVADMVYADYDRLQQYDRIQLEYDLMDLLREKCGDLNGDIQGTRECSEERLSFLIVNEAAKAYPSIEKYQTIAHKTEQIYTEYEKSFIDSLHTMLQNQTPAQIAQTDAKIQQRLNEVSMEAKRDLQKALLPKEFSGRGIGRILRLERGTKYLTRTVMHLGADCFDEVSVSVDTTFRTVRSLKRVSRILLAQFVWNITRNHKEWSVNIQLLPSYVSADVQQEYFEQEKQFRVLLTERVRVQKKLEQAEAQLAKIEKSLEDEEDRLELDMRDYEETQMQFMSLESKKDEYISGSRPESETKNYYNQVNDKKRELDRVQAVFEKRQTRCKELRKQKETYESERNSVRIQVEVVKGKTEKEVQERAQHLLTKWVAFFYKFQFEKELFVHLIETFTSAELLKLEEALKELHDSRETESYCYQKEDEICITYANIGIGKNITIRYQQNQIIRIERM